MPVEFKQADIFSVANLQAVAVGLNVRGGADVSPLYTTLIDRFPVFMGDYQRRARSGKLTTGAVWVWREHDPWLVGLVVRDSAQGPPRVRYVEAACIQVRDNWRREQLRALAIAQFADDPEWSALRDVIREVLAPVDLPVTVYETSHT